jgi:ABC-type lipoprotein export system ATPase subunit
MMGQIAELEAAVLMERYPYAADFFSGIGLAELPPRQTVAQIIAGLPYDFLQDCGMGPQQILADFYDFMKGMEERKREAVNSVNRVTIRGGRDKNGVPEEFDLHLHPGEVVCIVGPTGSGKSRLLADIECLAQADTPTGRRVLVNDQVPEPSRRFALEHKLVAQLSQNMNFVVDLTVEEFLTMHAESRMVPGVAKLVEAVIACANELAGEKFASETSLTQLSGGQSRALMIADVALLSVSPIVLIDEIENAGVDRKKALELLVRKEKIVLMATHDPILALMGRRRIVIKNGGINRILEADPAERANLVCLEKIDRKLAELRNRLRAGEMIDMNVAEFLQSE